MGFKDMFNMKLQSDPVQGGMKPIFSAEEKHRLQRLVKEMEKDEQDAEFNQENVGNEKITDHVAEKKLIEQQAKIDHAKVLYYYKALEKGIPLTGDQIYEELIEMYPYY